VDRFSEQDPDNTPLYVYEDAIKSIVVRNVQFTDDFQTNLPDLFTWEQMRYKDTDYVLDDEDMIAEVLMRITVKFIDVIHLEVESSDL